MSQRLILCAAAIVALSACNKPATDADSGAAQPAAPAGVAPTAVADAPCAVEGVWDFQTEGGMARHNIAADGSVTRPGSPDLRGTAVIDEARNLTVTVEDPQYAGVYTAALDKTCKHGTGKLTLSRAPEGQPATGDLTVTRY